MEEVFKLLAAGGDLFTIGIVLALYKLDKRMMKLEWSADNEKAGN